MPGEANAMQSRALLLVVATAAALLLAELGVRWLDPAPRPLHPLEVNTYRLSQNPILKYEYRPDYRAGDAPINPGHRGFETNSDGFRDDEHPLDKPPGTLRIAVLGDSVTAGVNIPDRSLIFPERLEELLNRAPASGPRYEVLNLGVGGYTTLQEVELLRVRGLAYDPDLVVLVFCVNDFDPDSDGGVFERLTAANPDYDPSLLSRSGLGRALESSRLAFFAYHRLRLLMARDGEPADDRERLLAGRSNVEVGFELLDELRHERGFRVLVAIVPVFRHGLGRYQHGDVHARMMEIAARFPRIEVVDLLPGFRRIDERGAAFSHDGVHPHPRGHAVLAGLLYDELRERGYLNAAPGG